MLIQRPKGRERCFQKKTEQILVDNHVQQQQQQQHEEEEKEGFTLVSLDESFFSFMILLKDGFGLMEIKDQ